MTEQKKVYVYQICECDAVAAYSEEEAREWYKQQTGLEDKELYTSDEVEVLPPEYKVYKAETKDEMITIQEIIDSEWKGEPFIACSTEW